MRISTNYQYDTFQYDIHVAQERLSTASSQLSSGKRINSASDDPVGVSRTVSMRSLRAGMEQYGKNLNAAKGALGFTDTTMQEISTLLQRAYQLGVSGASSSTDQSGRNAMAAEIATMQS